MATLALAWARENGIDLRDAIVLLPFAQLLAPARAAFAVTDAWLPRIETTQTLAASLGPAALAEPGQISFDPAIDRLVAARLLRGQPWGLGWSRRDPRGFDSAVAELVAAAHALARAAAAVAPGLRAEHWVRARQVLAPVAGPGAEEQTLARVALEWASAAPTPATDRLFALRASAWIVVQAGGADALCSSLVANADETPSLWIDTDSSDDEPFAASVCRPTLAVCADFEDEAECAAAEVIAHLQAGVQPVALVAVDRLLVRRVRALLERHRVRLHDETGWKLSTTRAAAQVIGLFDSSQPDAPTDAVLDWLKSGVRWPGANDADAAIAALEAHCRRHQVWRVAAIDASLQGSALADGWAQVASVLRLFASLPRQPLAAWLGALTSTLRDSGLWPALQADDAGRQALAALHLMPMQVGGDAWARGADAMPLTSAEFDAWVRSVLEQESFVPTHAPAGDAQVVITPLARVMLRPFAALVLPGADDRHLGGQLAPHPLFNDHQAAALGVATAAQRRHTQLQCFVHALAMPNVSLLRRRVDGAEPLADSPWVERLGMALAQLGESLRPWRDPRVTIERTTTPIDGSSPSAPDLLPARWSASALEALRACPYRFFALNMLRLREDDELDGELEKRDFGNWLHAVLHRFHLGRDVVGEASAEIARLHELARDAQLELGFDAAEFLPFTASFADFAPRYIAWLHQRDAEGAQWLHGEHAVSTALQTPDGVELHGVIDRIDRMGAASGAALQLIDYKTGSASALEAKVREPLEDTQLAFYAALMRSQTDAPLAAAYLALDGKQGIREIEHAEVEASANALLDGVAIDIARLRLGAGMPALGAGSTCEFCAARGICRRDHWSTDAGAGA